MTIGSFVKIWTLGERPTQGIFDGEVEITEKIDGSQFNFGRIDGVVRMKSKRAEIFYEDDNKMFALAKAFVLANEEKLPEGTIFHGEYLSKPKHNILTYGRAPAFNFVLFGVSNPGQAEIYSPEREAARRNSWAEALGCEAVPVIYTGMINSPDIARTFLRGPSFLGGCEREGIVIKNYAKEIMIGGQYFPICCAKIVTEEFKERHKVDWKAENKPDPIEAIGKALNVEARWRKAIQHLREEGILTHSPKDIGPLLKEINHDIEAECTDYIKEALYQTFRKDILRLSTRGFPEWYKGNLNEVLDESLQAA